ncbi:MAG: 2-isopropylmalate synthase [Acidobacteriota bacterium]
MSEKIYIFDTSLRDGEQSPGCSMNIEEKLKMASQLERLNVDIIEAGFPISSEGDFNAVRAIATEVRKPTIAALARATRLDIDRAWEAIQHAAKPRIHTFLATSDIHLQYKLKKTREQVLEQAVESVRHAKSLAPEVEFSAEDAMRSDLKFLCTLFEAVIEAGADIINIPDTVGYSIPWEIYDKFSQIIQGVPNSSKAIFSVHCHNDLGLAVANSLAAVRAGARQIECTVNGIGERAGNASLEEIVMTLRTRADLLPYHTDVTAEEISRSSRLLSNLTGMFVQANKAIVGRNAFAHEAGIHQDGVLKNALTYEIMTPQSVGIQSSTLVMGKHSGRHALKNKYEELGYELSDEELEKAYRLFTKVADQKKEIFDEDLVIIVQDGIKTFPDTYALKFVQTTGGNLGVSTSTIKLAKGEQVWTDSACGDGPIDATYKAIERITGTTGKLLDYQAISATRGKDAIGEVFVHVTIEGKNYTGKAASTDIIDASARAYLHAVNKALHERRRQPDLPQTSVAGI